MRVWRDTYVIVTAGGEVIGLFESQEAASDALVELAAKGGEGSIAKVVDPVFALYRLAHRDTQDSFPSTGG